jgi:phosphatidylserine decarboxylase
MTNQDERTLDLRYRALMPYRAGYLPSDLESLHICLRALKERVENQYKNVSHRVVSPTVGELEQLIERDGIVRMYVDQMIYEVPGKYRTVEDIPQLLAHLDHITRTAPEWESDPKKRNFFPLSLLFSHMMMTAAGEAAFRNHALNDAIRRILQEWCCFLDSANSLYVINKVMPDGRDGWLSEPAIKYNKLDEFVAPDKSAAHWGWRSFNAFFHREIQASKRPIAAPGNPKVITSANDGTVYKIVRGVQEQDQFWIKGQPYSLTNMLAGSAYVDRFIDGDVFQSFLSGADYHRWHAPIDGIVRQAYVVDGLMFSNAQAHDPSTGTNSQGYETSVNTRGLVFIESDDPVIGMVCCMPVGITEISSVSMSVKRGDQVKKGDELGYFSYGGSSMALVFQPGAIDHFTVPSPPHGDWKHGVPIQVNAQIAQAN